MSRLLEYTVLVHGCYTRWYSAINCVLVTGKYISVSGGARVTAPRIKRFRTNNTAVVTTYKTDHGRHHFYFVTGDYKYVTRRALPKLVGQIEHEEIEDTATCTAPNDRTPPVMSVDLGVPGS